MIWVIFLHGPTSLVQNLHPAYTHVIFAFIGWDTNGELVNQWDAEDKSFILSKTIVAGLQQRSIKVLMSLGGGAGNILSADAPSTFASTMLSALLGLHRELGFDGLDFDLENFTGADPIADMAPILAVIAGLKVALPGPLITCAPQMTDVYPDWPSVSAGFNRYASLLAAPSAVDLVMPQMYNTWAAVETADYAAAYSAKLLAGFVVADEYNVTVPAGKLVLGFPASASAAGSGFLPPAAVVALVRQLRAGGAAVAGLMTWDCGWDEQAGWQFAKAVAAG